ncbi:MAG TPA: hypothetical protein VKT50_03435 [Candidatus Acidoferrales bacterium]|nr:hypothetical protein [Candidatus Acidoferrales bacterium]
MKKIRGVLLFAVLVLSSAAFCRASSAQQAQKPLANADVLKLLRSGISEQNILDAIRTHPATFDVSNQARASFDKECAAIKPANISTGAWATKIGDVWNAMKNVVICQETNGRGGEGACDLNPLQSSPRNTSSAPATIPSKGNGRTEYEAVTLERGVTHDPGFANWANSAQQGQKPVINITPTRTNPQRDAAPLADAATKAKTELKLETQFAAFRNARASVTRVPMKTPAVNVREIEALKRQEMFVDALRKQAGIEPLKAASGQLGANSKTMATTQTSQTNNQTTIGSAPVPMRITPAGSSLAGSGTLQLSGGTNQGGSKTVAPPQTIAPAGSPSTGSGTLLLGGGTNQGSSKTVASSQTVAPVGAPMMRQVPTSSAQYQPPSGPNPKLVQGANTRMCVTAQIYSVNGVSSVQNATSPVVFTQDPVYNDYIITGCGFGNTEGGQVYLSGAVTGGRINMTVYQWTPTMIEAKVQAGLTGVLDGWPDLFVVPPGGSAPAKFANCRFYAQRQSVLLPSIPQNYAHLASETVGDGKHGFGTMYCPGPGQMHLFPCISFNYGEPLDGVTNNPSQRGLTSTAVSNAVDRDGGPLQFNPGEDVYDLSNLAPGFAIDYFGVHWYTWSQSACDDFRINEMKAGDTVNWSYQGRLDQYFQKGSQIIVDWPVDYCTSNWIGLFRDFSYYNSGYSLEVHVKGPIGVDPWTGQPTSGN